MIVKNGNYEGEYKEEPVQDFSNVSGAEYNRSYGEMTDAELVRACGENAVSWAEAFIECVIVRRYIVH